MIRKPPADWQRGGKRRGPNGPRRLRRRHHGSASVARRGGHVVRGLVCFFFAIIWGFAALAGGCWPAACRPSSAVGAMAAFMFWAGHRAFAKARETSG